MTLGQEETILKLLSALQIRDYETSEHVVRVASICKLLAESMKLPHYTVDDLYFASMMHDIGKIAIPDDILALKRKLLENEFEKVKVHSEHGAKVLKDSTSSVLSMAYQIALFHHENWDGGGYPSGVSRNEIPIAARITKLADSLDVMLTGRPYQAKKSEPETIADINDNSGRQFDPNVCKAFFEMKEKIFSLYR